VSAAIKPRAAHAPLPANIAGPAVRPVNDIAPPEALSPERHRALVKAVADLILADLLRYPVKS
jgi:hypothetical protein